MTNIPRSNSQEPSNHPVSLDTFLSTEESKLLDLIPRNSLNDDAKFELENIIIPSVKEDVEKILKGYLGNESDLRLLGDPKVLPKVMEDLGRVDWSLLGSMKKRVVVREVKWKEELEEGYKEVVREKMREMHSLEEWMNLEKTEKGVVKIIVGGKPYGLTALASESFFGTGGHPINDNDHMQKLLKEIYSPEEFEAYLQGIREKMREKYSLEECMNLTKIEKSSVKIIVGGKSYGLTALASESFFGTGGNPANNDDAMQNLLREIYSPEEFEAYIPLVKEKMREKHSLEEWMNLTFTEKGAVKIIVGGKSYGLTALASESFFGTGGNPVNNDDAMQNLLREIYSPEEFESYLPGVREKMGEEYSLEDWMNLTAREKGVVRIMVGGKEKGLVALARDKFFKIGGDPVNNSTDFKNLMIKIYGVEEVETYFQGVKEKVQSLYSLEQWMNLSQEKKGVVKIMIGGKENGLKALATFFKIEGDPVYISTDFKNLMIAIYGTEAVEKYSHLLKTSTRSKK